MGRAHEVRKVAMAKTAAAKTKVYSKYGKEILIDYLKTHDIDISKNYDDCGLILYDIKKQNVFAGASGPASSALVLCSYVLKEMKKGKLKKVLIVPTGAIFSPTRTFQKDSIPSIAHAISLEVSE